MGLLLALSLALAVHEPERTGGVAAPRTFFQDVRKLFGIRPYVLVALALGVAAISTSAATNWVPAFLARSHGMEQRHIVLFMAAAWGAGATSGGVVSGILTNWLYRKGGRWPLIVVGSLMIFFPAMCSVVFLAPSSILTLLAYGCALFLMGGIRGPAFATVQDIVPPSCQATANAFLMFSMYAIGVTFGPLLTGAISDALRSSLGTEALRYALLVVITSGGIISAALFFLAASGMARVSAERDPTDALAKRSTLSNAS
jgi:MFS family permease